METGAILMRVSLIAYQLTFKRQDLIRSIEKIATLSLAAENEGPFAHRERSVVPLFR